ncbi:ABC transporter permease [Aestuariivirga sp.]|uniref:ABC transporter permease n=1 Tax=Aestuariivirga sp. TaxID=2650926 RepID=UPI00391A01FF
MIGVAARDRRQQGTGFALALPSLLLMLVFFILPVAALLLRSVTEPELGLQNYRELLATSTYARVFLNTFLVAGITTLVTLLIGYPVAWLLAILPQRAAALIFGLILLSMWTNLLARTYAWLVLLQRTGVINRMLMEAGLIGEPLQLVNNLTGIIIGMVYIMLPFIILPLHASMRAIDPAVLQAAALCGAGRWQSFRRILLPLSAGGAAAGSLMIFVMSLGYFVTPALLGGANNMMLAGMIAQLIQSLLNWGLGGAAALVLLAVTLALYGLQIRLMGNALARGR